jgi:Mrp family chromosome partitioning ATPase
MRPTVGIEDCLSKRRGVQEALVRIQGYDRLTVLPARGRVEQSSDLLLSARMVELMLELRSRYSNRILIFDLPPVLLADDALAFSRLVQAGLFVVAESKTEREQLARGLMLLDKLPIIGTVLNLSKESIGSYY